MIKKKPILIDLKNGTMGENYKKKKPKNPFGARMFAGYPSP